MRLRALRVRVVSRARPIPWDVLTAVLTTADVSTERFAAAELIGLYGEQKRFDMARYVSNAHTLLHHVELLYRDFEARVMREGIAGDGEAL
jgi:hypothetical protein